MSKKDKQLKRELRQLENQLQLMQLEARLSRSNQACNQAFDMREILSFSVVKGMLK